MSAISSTAQTAGYVQRRTTAKTNATQKISRWYMNWRTRRQLAQLPDFMLKDIGVSRIDAEREASKPFWKE
ncbi:DUF1127 domain-containing protein [Marinobacter nauticus]|uniref:DUF1127 domain-containing protein n=1 Tax=Marinobacter nauticus TaxID=2743 RepID=UPI001C9A0E74|nr:DUF1127 domain-containing protein [Marinobacter nauticus]MBY5938116.1 DUF1127 domain-containing protein [Marinobacter nauticus]MBY5955345.1 DUF1127 domain-containing protein [Marinobacter nauticus]MBY6009136.1 DUF1127 domain-containing protein [Marinobacter nauticus]